MKSKFTRAIILGCFSLLAALVAAQWIGGNISIQIGGSNNKVEQKIDYTSSSRRR
jgi:hypothetical protein